MSAINLEQISKRLDVEAAVIAMFVATDRRDWTALEACFTDPFTLDMTSMVGGEPASLTPKQVSEAWAKGFSPLDQVHHQIGNLQTTVSGASAQVDCYGTAWHYRAAAKGGKTRVFVGTYVIDGAEGWRISRLVFKLKFIDGNPNLESD